MTSEVVCGGCSDRDPDPRQHVCLNGRVAALPPSRWLDDLRGMVRKIARDVKEGCVPLPTDDEMDFALEMYGPTVAMVSPDGETMTMETLQAINEGLMLRVAALEDAIRDVDRALPMQVTEAHPELSKAIAEALRVMLGKDG